MESDEEKRGLRFSSVDSAEDFLNANEVAEWLQMHRNTICRLAQLEAVPGRKIGRSWRFSRVALCEWVGEKKGPLPEMLTVGQVAEQLRVSETTIYKSLKQEDFPGIRIGNEWRYTQPALHRWLAKGTKK